jgi:hypothetical protein
MSVKFRIQWIWISSLVFGGFAGLFKAVFFPYPEFNPPAIYPTLVAFLLTFLLWRWLIKKRERGQMLRGGIVGAIVGLLTPILIWPFFLLLVSLEESRFTEIFFWSPIYMLISLKISWLTVLLGIVLGAVLGHFQHKVVEGVFLVRDEAGNIK